MKLFAKKFIAAGLCFNLVLALAGCGGHETPVTLGCLGSPNAYLVNQDQLAQRAEENQQLWQSPRAARDLAHAGIDAERIVLMRSKQLPLGFSDVAQYRQFKQELDAALRAENLVDATLSLSGTATTFYSDNPGKPLGHYWDDGVLEPSDFDMAISSETLATRLCSAGISVDKVFQVFGTSEIYAAYPALGEFTSKWSESLGRPVHIVGLPPARALKASDYVWQVAD
ncbi:MAG: hypothetical protein ACRYG5_11050 [Janthinobacterium lividum]